MDQEYYVQSVNRVESVLATNQVIRNTYILLSLTLLFSAFTAWFSMVTHAAPMGLVTMILYFGLLYLTHAFKDSAMGIVCVFALTGTLGYTLGPILNMYMSQLHNGGQVVMTALGGTGLIFLGLSGYTLTTRKDFSFIAGFMMAGFMVAFLASIAAIFLRMPALDLLISCAFLMLSSGAILFETSQIIHGGQRNYILATVSLYVSLFNIFVSLLRILAQFSGNNRN